MHHGHTFKMTRLLHLCGTHNTILTRKSAYVCLSVCLARPCPPAAETQLKVSTVCPSGTACRGDVTNNKPLAAVQCLVQCSRLVVSMHPAKIDCMPIFAATLLFCWLMLIPLSAASTTLVSRQNRTAAVVSTARCLRRHHC